MKILLLLALSGSAHAAETPARTLQPWGVPVWLLPPAPPLVTADGIPLPDVDRANPGGARHTGIVLLGTTGALLGTLLVVSIAANVG